MKRLAVAASMLCCLSQPVPAAGVGFSRIQVADPMGGRMQVSIWYPAVRPSTIVRIGSFSFAATRDAQLANGQFGLVVLSHGTGGSDLGHRNVAIALARAGIIAAAPLHPRDNYRDRSGLGHRVVMAGRPRQLSSVIDDLLNRRDWRDRIDRRRIGAFGFSLGGYTVLAASGAEPDFARIRPHCARAPEDPFCNIAGRRSGAANLGVQAGLTDQRVCAAVVADPVAVPFSDAALARIKVSHVQVWRPETENVLLSSAHASRVVRQLNSRPGRPIVREIVVQKAQHYSFLAPFPKALRSSLPPELVSDAPEFDRVRFQSQFAIDVAKFFSQSFVSCGKAN